MIIPSGLVEIAYQLIVNSNRLIMRSISALPTLLTITLHTGIMDKSSFFFTWSFYSFYQIRNHKHYRVLQVESPYFPRFFPEFPTFCQWTARFLVSAILSPGAFPVEKRSFSHSACVSSPTVSRSCMACSAEPMMGTKFLFAEILYEYINIYVYI